jgi:hypothetical protein
MYTHYHNVQPARTGLIQSSEIEQFLARTARAIQKGTVQTVLQYAYENWTIKLAGKARNDN